MREMGEREEYWMKWLLFRKKSVPTWACIIGEWVWS